MKRRCVSLLLVAVFLGGLSAIAQNTVTIDHTTQRFIGDVSELDRTKYFNIHSGGDDAEHTKLYNDYNVGQGRGFWSPFATRDDKESFPNYTPGTTNKTVRPVYQYVRTDHPQNVCRWDLSAEDAANFAVDYFLDSWNGDRPEFYEPMNEPFVHAGEAVFGGPDQDQMRLHMSAWYGAIGKAFDETPELANMKVVGYSSAWPSVELWDFGHWESRMKMFMDTAGRHMDAFATHLYDGTNVMGTGGRRSGSNSEAILDLIETYSYVKWDHVKPHAITEFGNIEQGYPDEYSDAKSVQTLRSVNHFLFNLLDRGDRIAISIPFLTGKATWFLNESNGWLPYGAVLWRPIDSQLGKPEPASGWTWTYTPRINFYKQWKNVKGKRVYVNSDNPDIQSHAFVDGKNLYVALSNLDDSLQTVNLEMLAGMDGLASVTSRDLKIYVWDDPVYTESTVTSDFPTTFDLIQDETIVLEYAFDADIAFADSISEKNYYCKTHLQKIEGDELTFNFNGVEVGEGHATLKMGIGRKHNKSKSPIVKVNGKQVRVPSNWKGYDQAARDDFFGVIDIPVPTEFLQEDNVITVKFPDTEGRVSSMILNVANFNNTRTVERSPMFDQPIIITEVIEVEWFDRGAEGLAYSDKTVDNSGGAYRTTGVDLEELASGATVLTSTEADEWLEYTVTLPGDATYQFDVTVAAATAGAFRLELDDVDKSGTISVEATGGDDTWKTISHNVELEKGTHILKLVVETGGFKIDNFTFTPLVSSVEISDLEIDLEVKEYYTLSHTVLPSFAANQKATWSSEDKTIATVTTSGRVKGISNGTTNIVITTEEGEKTATCVVNVSGGTAIWNSVEGESNFIYPNPFKNGTLWLDLTSFESIVQVSIYTFDGKLIRQDEFLGGLKTGFELGEKLLKGLYLVKVSSNTKSTSQKLIVK